MHMLTLTNVPQRFRRVAIGQFDGVHLGHREVIGSADTVVTFDPHPRQVTRPDSAPRLLTTLDEKADLIASLGVRELVVIPFDKAFARKTAHEFVDDVLIDRLGATLVSVGQNFRFGHKAVGDTAMLVGYERFTTRVVPLLTVDGEVVSSTRIRALVAAGDYHGAARLLGRPVWGGREDGVRARSEGVRVGAAT